MSQAALETTAAQTKSIVPVIPQHQDPVSKEDCIDTWKRYLRLSVPNKSGGVTTLIIKHWVDTVRFDGKPLDALLYAHETVDKPAEIIGLVFAEMQPDLQYPIPVLWVREGQKKWLPRLRTAGATAGV